MKNLGDAHFIYEACQRWPRPNTDNELKLAFFFSHFAASEQLQECCMWLMSSVSVSWRRLCSADVFSMLAQYAWMRSENTDDVRTMTRTIANISPFHATFPLNACLRVPLSSWLDWDRYRTKKCVKLTKLHCSIVFLSLCSCSTDPNFSRVYNCRTIVIYNYTWLYQV